MIRLLIIAVMLLVIPATSSASAVLRSGSDISIAADQAVEGDFYGLSDNVAVSGEVLGDLFITTAKLTINGKVEADLAAIAGNVYVDGSIGDDARIVGAEVTIAGEVKGDLVVLASNLKVLSTAKISGDLIFFGSNAEISGEVGKSVLGTSDSLRIDGVISGDIDVKTNSLSLGERTDIAGMVKYTSINELVRAQNARVAGKVVKNDPVIVDVGGFRDILIPFLVALFASLVWF
jgi:cytoskeletal protein CcmA (bactofilin family)